MSDKNHRIAVFTELGSFLQQFALNQNTNHHLNNTFFERMNDAMLREQAKNRWFTPAVQRQAFGAWAYALTSGKLEVWLNKYHDIQEPKTPKRVAIIMAGNIPLVGFHDLLTVLVLGHIALVKLSQDDAQLLPVIKDILVELYPDFAQRIFFVDRIENPDAVIATGSNNSARYFESYFARFPHVIRKNRTSVALISGNESNEELSALGSDIFSYYGLGCRNVSKVYVPRSYDLNNIFAAIVGFDGVVDNNKYVNNYEYYRTVYMLNKIPFLENGFVIFKEDTSLHTPIAVIHYEYYDDLKTVQNLLESTAEELQCAVGRGENLIPFGKAQQPELWDYADGVDTVEFLQKLSK
jgi:hypothetical protein